MSLIARKRQKEAGRPQLIAPVPARLRRSLVWALMQAFPPAADLAPRCSFPPLFPLAQLSQAARAVQSAGETLPAARLQLVQALHQAASQRIQSFPSRILSARSQARHSPVRPYRLRAVLRLAQTRFVHLYSFVLRFAYIHHSTPFAHKKTAHNQVMSRFFK